MDGKHNFIIQNGILQRYSGSGGDLILPLSELAEVEIPKLYGGEVSLDNLICVAPVIRK